jgi:hypothetical protein
VTSFKHRPDILIGAADLYEWHHIKPWLVSARETGFTGDIYLIAYRVASDVKAKAAEYGATLYECDHTPYGTSIQHQQQGSPTQAHNLRFYHAWELLTRLDPEDYRYAMMTDVRDVIFQDNPFSYCAANLLGPDRFLASSEGIAFEDEEWNRENMIRGFGQIHYDLRVKSRAWRCYNVGVLAGGAQLLANLFHAIFSMTEGRYYPSDQSSFNTLLNGVFRDYAKKELMTEPWAAQLGTTMDPTKAWLWERTIEAHPQIKNGQVYTATGKLFHVVHQWDRVPELKQLINAKYNDV